MGLTRQKANGRHHHPIGAPIHHAGENIPHHSLSEHGLGL